DRPVIGGEFGGRGRPPGQRDPGEPKVIPGIASPGDTAGTLGRLYPPGTISNFTAWPASAALAFQMARAGALTPFQATDFAAAQYGESGFNPRAVNKTSGAAGLYQLLSSGYVNRANQLGGVLNPEANIQAILPSYAQFYRQHPGARAGEAAAAVE